MNIHNDMGRDRQFQSAICSFGIPVPGYQGCLLGTSAVVVLVLLSCVILIGDGIRCLSCGGRYSHPKPEARSTKGLAGEYGVYARIKI